MIGEIRQISQGIFNYKKIKLLSTHKGNEGYNYICSCDGDLVIIRAEDLEEDIDGGCYELVEKSAIPARLKTALEKLIYLQKNDPDNPQLDKIRKDAMRQIPEKWLELFASLIKAEILTMGKDEYRVLKSVRR